MTLGQRFEEALVYAARVHASQRRKGTGTPYVGHVLAVCALALENGAREEEAIAALLHDAAEDQGGAARLAEIRERFGEAVAKIVEGCSDSLEADAAKKAPWEGRKRRYLEHLAEAPASVVLVSVCDKIHNARAIVADLRRVGGAAFEQFKGKREGTMWYYRELIEIYRRRAVGELAEELRRIVAEMERLGGK